MRMKFTFKSLLLAAGLLVGSTNAWAEITEIPFKADFTSSAAPFDSPAYNRQSSNGQVNAVAVANGSAEATFAIDGKAYPLKNGEEVTVSFTMYNGWVSGGSNNTFAILNSENVVLASITYNNSDCIVTDVTLAGKTVGSFAAFKAQGRKSDGSASGANGFNTDGRGNPYIANTEANTGAAANNGVVTIKINSYGNISLSFVGGSGNIDNIYYDILPDGTKIDLAKLTISNANNNEDRATGYGDLNITSEVSEIPMAQYTINYVDAESNVLKTEQRMGNVGANVDASIADKSTFYSEDANYKYVFDEEANSESVEITENGNAILTVIFKKYGKYTATLNAVNGDGTLKSFTKDAYEDENATFSISKYIQVEDKWYSTDVTDFMPVTTAQNAELSIEYTPADISYFFEETDFTLSRDYITTDERSIYSGGSGHGLYANASAYKSVDSGVYTLVIAGASRRADKTASVGYGYRLNGENVKTGDTENITSTSSIETRTYTVAIPQGADFCLIENRNENSFLYIDYVTLTRISDVSVAISPAGYSTFSSEYTVTIPEELTAYIATATDVDGEYKGTVTLQEVTGAVAANTGLLLKGDAGETYQLPLVAEEGESYEGVNLLKPTAADGKVAAGNYIFAYNNSDASECGFYYLESEVEVGAGKAYLAPEVAGINVLRFAFGDGTATAIEAPAAEAEAEGAIYNVAGQQVGNDYKGIVIKNGKKYLNK